MTKQRTRAVVASAVTTAITLVLIYIGSRGLRDFDAASLGGVRRGTVISAVISGVIFAGGLCVIHLRERRLLPRD